MGKFSFVALFLSVLIHSVIFSGVFFYPHFKEAEQIKIETKEIEIIAHEPERKIDPPRKNYQKINKQPLPYQEEAMSRLLETKRPRPTSLAKTRQLATKVSKISLSNLASQKEIKESPAYMDYYRTVREKIRKNAYQNYQGLRQGEIYLNFNIGKDGSLRSLELTEQSSQDNNLKEIALSSVKRSAPFPPFPEDLKDYPQLQFSISIHFKHN